MDSHTTAKITQYLGEALATEKALTRVLESQIAMTPHGPYRTALDTHLRETRDHARRVAARLEELGEGTGVVDGARRLVVGAAQVAIGQALALGKTPLDLVRGHGHDEKVLKNAKDACATEALEIATYTAIEHLARTAGDTATADLAASILDDEERMLARIRDELPHLTDRVTHGAGATGSGPAAVVEGDTIVAVRERDGRASRRPKVTV